MDAEGSHKASSGEDVRLCPADDSHVAQGDSDFVMVDDKDKGSRKNSIPTSRQSASRNMTPVPTAEEKPKKKKKRTRGVELPVHVFKSRGERDPEFINQDLRVNFNDVIAEPEGYYTPKYSWHLSQEVYGFGKGCCYSIATFFCAIPAALFWGIIFSLLACINVWCLVPIRRCATIKMAWWKALWGVFVSACCDPFYQSCGMIFNNMSMRTEKHIV